MGTMEQLSAVFRRVFDDDTIVVTSSTTANDVPGWDSLSHMNLIIAIEAEFRIEFTQKEAVGFRNAGELADCIERKISSKA
jgi:acyl carrier protein